jgi:Mrp family chromosome partitioning ATPase
LLVDLNLRQPRVSEMLGMARASSLEALLSGRAELEESVFRCGKNLAVAPNGQSVQRGAELLQNARTLSTMEAMVQAVAPKFVIYDMPALRPTDEALSFLATVDCAILVLEADTTTREEADLCEIELSKATSVLGVVLNKCRYPLNALET